MRYLLALCAAVLVSCSTQQSALWRAPADSVRHSIVAAGLPRPETLWMADSRYLLPTEHWVREKFLPAYERFLYRHDRRGFVEDDNDCDDYALFARVVANLTAGGAVACGEVDLLDGLDGHRLVFFVLDDGTVLFFEPQHLLFFRADAGTLARALFWRI